MAPARLQSLSRRSHSSGAPRYVSLRVSSQSSPFVTNGEDCDDTRRETYRGAPELCDRRDNDCSLAGAMAGGVDPSEDVDDDHHAAPSASCLGPRDPGGLAFAFPKDDCNDASASVY